MISTIIAASTFAGLAAAAPVANIFATAAQSVTTFGPFTATHFYSTEFEGSCGFTNRTNQYIVSIATNKTSESACGKTVNITSQWNGKSILAQVVDERTDVPTSYLNLSRVAFEALHPITYENFTATYVFSNATVPVYVPTSEPASSPEAQNGAPAASPKKESTPTTSSSEEAQWTPTSSSKKQEWTPTTTSSSQQQWTQQQKQAEWTPSSSSKQQQAAYTPQAQSQSSGGQSGTVTWYTQNGNAGACGNYNSDGAYIAALSPGQYNGGSACGKQIRISSGGNTITVTVADECMGCGYGHIDLSTGAFQALGSLGQGQLSTTWSWA